MTFTDVHTDRQKLGTILENKVVQKLKFLKNVNNKKPAPKLIFHRGWKGPFNTFSKNIFSERVYIDKN